MLHRYLNLIGKASGASAALIASAQGYGMAALRGLAIVLLAVNFRDKPKQADSNKTSASSPNF
jgi:hypothetical protein